MFFYRQLFDSDFDLDLVSTLRELKNGNKLAITRTQNKIEKFYFILATPAKNNNRQQQLSCEKSKGYTEIVNDDRDTHLTYNILSRL